jgi:hypothetical protein
MIPFEKDSVIGMHIDGHMDEAGIKMIWEAIEDKAKRNEKLQIYVEIREPGFLSFRAWMENIPIKFKYFFSFDREAIVSDKKWIENLAALSAPIFPYIRIRHYSFEEIPAAKRWISR